MNISHLHNRFKQYFLYEKGCQPKSFKAIISTLNMLQDKTGYCEIKDMSTNIIRQFLNENKDKRQWTVKTYRNHRQNIKSFFDWCILENITDKNPVLKIQKPKLPKYLPRCITKEESHKILLQSEWIKWYSWLERIRNPTIIATFLMTGIRLQELINLRIEDVDIREEEIFIRQGKGKKDRMIPIHYQLMGKLKMYIAEIEKNGKQSRWFFPTVKLGRQLTDKNIQRICRRISEQTGVYFTPHMLRHTFGRLSIDADMNLYKVKEIMGHEQILTTQRYLSVSKEAIKKSFGKIDLI
jgi:site-specific recombinase XerD